MDEFEDDASIYAGDEDELYGAGLEQVEAERRNALERIGREAAETIMDLSNSGPLSKYVKSRRKSAIAAIKRLVEATPGDVQSIAESQAAIREYLMATEWIMKSINDAKMAADTIEREYGNGEEIDDNYQG